MKVLLFTVLLTATQVLKKAVMERPRVQGSFSSDEYIRFIELQIQPPVNTSVRLGV